MVESSCDGRGSQSRTSPAIRSLPIVAEEGALFAHLQGHPTFTACLDAWWVEPIRHGVFRMQYPFMELPNVIGSPHNSASVGGGHHVALQREAENCRRALTGEQPTCLIGPEERMV